MTSLIFANDRQITLCLIVLPPCVDTVSTETSEGAKVDREQLHLTRQGGRAGGGRKFAPMNKLKIRDPGARDKQ